MSFNSIRIEFESESEFELDSNPSLLYTGVPEMPCRKESQILNQTTL